MQQIAYMRVDMQRRQDLPPPGFTANATDGRPPIYVPSLNMDPTQNQPSTAVQNPPNIDMTTQNPQYASASYQTPPTLQNNHPQMPPPHPQNPTIKPLHHHKIQNENQNKNTFNP